MGEVTQWQNKSVVVSGIQLNEEKKGEKLGFNVQRSECARQVLAWSRLRTPDTAMRPWADLGD